MIKKYVGTGIITLGLLFSAVPVFAQTTDVAAQIATLLAQIKALQAQIAQLQGQPASAGACVSLSYNLYADQTDATTNGGVSKLQQFLGQDSSVYPSGLVTGYFGPMTEAAVQRWQAAHGVVSSGSADTTGYGYVGPKTRAAMSCGGQTSQPTNTYVPPTTYTPPSTSNAKSNLVPDTLKIIYPSSDTNIGIGQKITVTYSVGANIVAGDPAIVERKIVNAGTDASVSGYVPVSVSGGTYTFDWTPNEAGKYQVVLNITHNNTTYPARSGVIIVGNPVTPSTNTSPSITFSYLSSGNVIGSFANLPANSQIRFVNASTGQRYDAQSTMVWGGGSGPLSITIPNDLPNGTYYLRTTDYYNPNTTIAQSGSFQAGANVQTNSVVINSFTASPTTINAGQAVLFMWSSNLTQNDVSYYGGGCSIEGITQNNVALNVTPGLTSASGQVTYVPPGTATYTIFCTSGGKDGSPSATKQITVNVGQPQTNPVVISSFNASQTSVSSGQPVTFTWNSNLSSNDVSYYGGFCSISALTSYNQQIHITSGAGASGSVTYTPALTATYTLTCSAGGKDGSPMDTKQVTVSVQ